MPRATAVVFIVDPEVVPVLPVDRLKHLYGLTQREAILASELATGSTVEDAAEQLAITYETARTHLRRIFSKTETSRQSELVSLLIRVSVQVPSRVPK
jgi:DNA-binding CsgD family transcriptional regulator